MNAPSHNQRYGRKRLSGPASMAVNEHDGWHRAGLRPRDEQGAFDRGLPSASLTSCALFAVQRVIRQASRR